MSDKSRGELFGRAFWSGGDASKLKPGSQHLQDELKRVEKEQTIYDLEHKKKMSEYFNSEEYKKDKHNDELKKYSEGIKENWSSDPK
jgi:hypothetical protein